MSKIKKKPWRMTEGKMSSPGSDWMRAEKKNNAVQNLMVVLEYPMSSVKFPPEYRPASVPALPAFPAILPELFLIA